GPSRDETAIAASCPLPCGSLADAGTEGGVAFMRSSPGGSLSIVPQPSRRGSPFRGHLARPSAGRVETRKIEVHPGEFGSLANRNLIGISCLPQPRLGAKAVTDAG